NAAVSQVTAAAKPSVDLQFWLQGLTPQTVSGFSATSDGLVFATRDKGVLFVDARGQIVNQMAQDELSAALAAPDGRLYTASGDQQSSLSAFSTSGTPGRFGGTSLILGVPVVGTVSEAAPQQIWTFDGVAGQHITLSAVDQSRTDASVLGLDMALHLLAPDG